MPTPDLDAWDAEGYVNTMLVVDGTYHLFYQGHEDGLPLLRFYDIGHATSDDGVDEDTGLFAFDPFLDAAEAARTAPVLVAADIEDSPLGSWLDAHLLQLEDRWVALTSLVEPQPEALAALIADAGLDAGLVDFQEASVSLVRDYRATAMRTILVAALLIVAILWWVRGDPAQTAWVALTVTASLTVTVAIIGFVHGALTVIHMVALLLVLGLGLDYALFLSRSEAEAERKATDRGVLACAASTTIAFMILAASSIPVLKFLGLTVATGSLVSFAVAWAGSRRLSRRVS